MNMLLLCLAVGFLLSWLLTATMRRYALNIHLLDLPNERSAHTIPTPRGGGVAIVASFSLLVLGCALQGTLPLSLTTALLVGTVVVAVIGFVDDRKHVPARWRLLCHVVAAACCLWGLRRHGLSGMGSLLLMVGLLYLVWMVNLCNFMDGIDGIASVQAVTVCTAASLVTWLTAPQSPWWLPLLFASCAAGFLVWNFPPARIFMGDAGSGYMGLVLGFLSLVAAAEQPRMLWVWLILMACFLTDATLTLVRRVAHGERFYEAHRLHAYQYAARRHRSHLKVTMATAGVNFFWLLPLATAVGCHKLSIPLGLSLAYAPLVFVAWHYKAGDRQGQEGQ